MFIIQVSGLEIVFPLGRAERIVDKEFGGVPYAKKEFVDRVINRIFAITTAKMPEDNPQLSGKGNRKQMAFDSLFDNGECGKPLSVLPAEFFIARLATESWPQIQKALSTEIGLHGTLLWGFPNLGRLLSFLGPCVEPCESARTTAEMSLD